jgi:molecular chaperone GrpE (heat shock protein)
MNDHSAPKVTKWPFFAADLVLLGLALWIVSRQPHPLGPAPLALMVGCVVAAAWFAVWPFRLEYDTADKLTESRQLTSAVAEINKLQAVADQVRSATGQWQSAQDHSAKSVAAAKDIGDRMTAEAKAFADFIQKANDSEKAHLRLETEKLRRGETEWLHTTIRLLDHIFALRQAGVRSGQRNLVQQLTGFQDACRDITRRLGLAPVEAVVGEAFDPAKHQLAEGQPEAPDGATVEDTLATGYNFQGQMLRRTLVTVRPAGQTAQADESSTESAGELSGETVMESDTETIETQIASVPPERTTNPAAEEPMERRDDPSFRLESESLLADESPERRDA